MQSPEVQLVDPPKPQHDNPYDSPEYAAFVESMAKHCHCEPAGSRPCDGVLAGGLCDGMDWTERHRDYDDDHE